MTGNPKNINETEKKVPVINLRPTLNGQAQEGSNCNKTNPAQIKNKQNKQELRFKVWNIHGLKQSKLSKIINKSDKFLNDIFRKPDFVIFMETWSENGDGELFTWDNDNFEEIIRKNGQRTSRRGRSSGGISFSTRKNLAQGYDILSEDSYRIWYRFHKTFFGWELDIIVCFLYIPTSDSNWHRNGKSFNYDRLKDETAIYKQLGCVILSGDFKGWLGLENDFVNNDDIDEFLPLPNNYILDNANLLSERKSCDHESGLKEHVKEIIEFCKMSGFRIANG